MWTPCPCGPSVYLMSKALDTLRPVVMILGAVAIALLAGTHLVLAFVVSAVSTATVIAMYAITHPEN